MDKNSIPIFRKFKNLKKKIPHISLCDLPTPCRKLQQLSNSYKDHQILIKEDNLTSSFYGGNKARKLEFLLAEAKNTSCKKVLTFGFAGSNHAAATAVHAKQTGLTAISILAPQPKSPIVRNNLIVSANSGAELNLSSLDKMQSTADERMLWHEQTDKIKPYLIPAGGSSSLGTIGFVNAAFELNEQINNNSIIKPDIIFIPLGTAGTVTGLLLGFALVNLKVKIHAVRVVDPSFMNLDKVRSHFKKTLDFLEFKSDEKLNIPFPEDDLFIDDNFFDPGYGYSNTATNNAIQTLQKLENITLEQTYSGKTMAALLNYAENNNSNKNLLFWNTFNSSNQADLTINPENKSSLKDFSEYL